VESGGHIAASKTGGTVQPFCGSFCLLSCIPVCKTLYLFPKQNLITQHNFLLLPGLIYCRNCVRLSSPEVFTDLSRCCETF